MNIIYRAEHNNLSDIIYARISILYCSGGSLQWMLCFLLVLFPLILHPTTIFYHVILDSIIVIWRRA